LALTPGADHQLAVQMLVLAQGRRWGSKKQEPGGTAAVLALGAARTCSRANLIACCCQNISPTPSFPSPLHLPAAVEPGPFSSCSPKAQATLQ